MSNLKNQSAFPLEYEEYNSTGLLCKRQEFGMSKLEQISAMILQGLVSNTNLIPNETDLDYAIEQSVKSAEKLLNILEVKNKNL